MSPTGQYPVTGIRRFVPDVLFVTGILGVIAGFSILAVEVFHQVKGTHPTVWGNYGSAAGFIIGGASMIQTGSVKETVNVLVSILPMMGYRRDGRRAGDKLLKELTDEHTAETVAEKDGQ